MSFNSSSQKVRCSEAKKRAVSVVANLFGEDAVGDEGSVNPFAPCYLRDPAGRGGRWNGMSIGHGSEVSDSE
jgi:hypothetical protein